MTAALIFKIIIVLLLLAVLASLASGMFFLINDKGESDRTVKSLTIRITLSIALFLMLIIGYFTGMIQPHGISPEAPETERALQK